VILNELLRPFLSEWHPALEDWESRRPEGVSRVAHEHEWERHGEIRDALESVRSELERYAGYLAEVADVPSLTATAADC
jgi:hypothetical protein